MGCSPLNDSGESRTSVRSHSSVSPESGSPNGSEDRAAQARLETEARQKAKLDKKARLRNKLAALQADSSGGASDRQEVKEQVVKS